MAAAHPPPVHRDDDVQAQTDLREQAVIARLERLRAFARDVQISIRRAEIAARLESRLQVMHGPFGR